MKKKINGHDDPVNRAESLSLPKDISLFVDYLPSKFSSGLLSPGARRRKGRSDLPKQGGHT